MRTILQPSLLPRTLFLRIDSCSRGVSQSDKGGVNPGKLLNQRFFKMTETFLIAAMWQEKFKS